MSKSIKFIPFNKKSEIVGTTPHPAIKFLPEWYKKISHFTNNEKKLHFPIGAGVPNITVKRCVPLLDAMTTGYMVTLDDDVYVEIINGELIMRWRTEETMITWHDLEQFNGFIIPETHHNMVAKWHNDWGISVPEGYSIYFTHPSNRFDLPFYTLSGVVDCDTYNNPVQFPFILRNNFEGIIESGTPVAQLIMFKRENWKSTRKKYKEEEILKKNKKFFGTFISSYKKNYWHKKSYE